ncbi:MAG: DUF5060 domain-containing protein, partial [Mangrovibacterium sp.]
MKILLLIICCAFSLRGVSQQMVERWEIFELRLKTDLPRNPFVGVEFYAEFTQDTLCYSPEGFYDGEGTYVIRFMPTAEGRWKYTTHSNLAGLDKQSGEFICTPATKGNHGPVRIRNTYHFEFCDGTPYYPFGTTIYEWAFQNDAKRARTLQSLKNSPFNKARMLAVPPYGENYQQGPDALQHFPYVGTPPRNWDFSRFDPLFFQDLEQCVRELQDQGVVIDLILFRPYDKGRWGFDTMSQNCKQQFVRYVLARFASFRNIWWSLCNENSFIEGMTDQDWDELFQTVETYDPYGHMRSIHNAGRIYNYSKPWVSHVSLQYYNAVRVPGVSPLLRDLYRK